MREIVTLQLGNFSNYVATHFWNAQESYFTYSDTEELSPVDHDVHWRAGVGADGSDTFLPRTLIYDLKGGFGPLRKINPLYDVSAAKLEAEFADESLWHGKPSVHKQTPLELGSYQQSLDAGTKPAALTPASVRYWSDYSRVYYHPRSSVQLYDFELHSAVMPFERFGMGTELFRSLDRDNDIVDRDARPFVEECDQMQGFQVFTTLDDAWGGFASSYVEALRDEHPKACIWVWGLQTPVAPADGITREKRRLRMGNVAQALNQTCSQASMVVPLTMPARPPRGGVSLDTASRWHTSALLATAAETLLLPSRLRLLDSRSQRHTRPASLWELTQSLNIAGNQTLANMRMAVASRASRSDDTAAMDIDLSQVGYLKDDGKCDDSGSFFGRVSTLRGVADNVDDDAKEQAATALDSRPIIGNSVVRRYDVPLKFPLLDSFPSIYSEAAVDQASMPVHAAVSTDKSIFSRMKQLRTQSALALDSDERETLANGLAEIGDAYQDDWYSGSDLDDDDL